MPIFLFIFFLLMVMYALLINYYQRGWNRIPEFVPAGQSPHTFISVVIAVRNEEEHIGALLQSLACQQYPASLFEVIIVDDHSTDNTWQILEEHPFSNLQLKKIRLAIANTGEAPIIAYKKKAIETGIREARGKLIVTTDADCRFPETWLSTLAAFHEANNAKFIAAPVRMWQCPGLLGVFQTLDFITLQGITGASVHQRFHSMCNGANLAYERAAFFEVNGFAGIDSIPSGDDMLLMHKIALRYPEHVFYLKSKAALVTTAPAASWKAFFHQRIRWASKADRYQDKRIFRALLLVYLVNAGFLVLAIAACWKSIWLFFLLLLLLAKTLIEFPFVQTAARFFDQQQLMWYFPFLQPLHIVYTIIAGWLGKFGSYQWKGRTIKKTQLR